MKGGERAAELEEAGGKWRAASLMLCGLQVVANIAPQAAVLGAGDLVGGAYFKAFVDASIAFAVLLMVVGLAGAGAKSPKTLSVHALGSVMFGSIVSAMFVSSGANMATQCSLNQIAFQDCSNFNKTYCAIKNTCTKGELQQASSGCLAPDMVTCQNVGAIVGSYAGFVALSIVINMACAFTANSFAIIINESRSIVASVSVSPSPAEGAASLEKRLVALEQLVEQQARELENLQSKLKEQRAKRRRSSRSVSNDSKRGKDGDRAGSRRKPDILAVDETSNSGDHQAIEDKQAGGAASVATDDL
jgi:hypothetical protein